VAGFAALTTGRSYQGLPGRSGKSLAGTWRKVPAIFNPMSGELTVMLSGRVASLQRSECGVGKDRR
jgi:hypothetical protein